jgi:hypothetical protein
MRDLMLLFLQTDLPYFKTWPIRFFPKAVSTCLLSLQKGHNASKSELFLWQNRHSLSQNTFKTLKPQKISTIGPFFFSKIPTPPQNIFSISGLGTSDDISSRLLYLFF